MLPFALLAFALLATASAQRYGRAGCKLNDLLTEGSLERHITQVLLGADDPTQPNITVLRNHTICLSVGPTRDTFSSISVVIEYNCTGSDSCPTGPGENTELFDFGCIYEGQWSHDQFYDFTHGRTTNATANFSTPLRTDCGACFPVHPDTTNPPTIDSVTHCHECRGCSDFGQTACYGDPRQCCSVYVNDTCQEACPSPSDVIDTNFTCGSLQSSSCSSDDAYVAVTVVLAIMAVLLTTALVIALVALCRLYTSNRKLSSPMRQGDFQRTFYRSNDAYEKSERRNSSQSYEEVDHDERQRQKTPDGSYSEVKEPGVTAGDVKEARIRAGDVKEPGVTAGDVKEAGITAGDVKEPGVTAGDVKEAGIADDDDPDYVN